jgi:hypothetical protein
MGDVPIRLPKLSPHWKLPVLESKADTRPLVLITYKWVSLASMNAAVGPAEVRQVTRPVVAS